MDIELQNRLNAALETASKLSTQNINFDQMDPVAKMMLVALVSETQKIHDYVDGASQRIAERFCTNFMPRQKVEAMPAVCLLHPDIREQRTSELTTIGQGASFTYKSEGVKMPLNYIPIFNTTLLPYKELYQLNARYLRYSDNVIDISMEHKNLLWVGVKTTAEVNSLKGLSLLVKGTNGMVPEHIYAGANIQEIDFSTMLEMENIEMTEPFDAQQSSGTFFSLIENWKNCLLNMQDAALLYITDTTLDRDLFKPRPYPKQFQQWLESEVLDCFSPDTIWMMLEFPENYAVPDEAEVVLNVLPVTNINVESLMLTQNQPIAKLQKNEDAFFLRILETSTANNRQGFNMTNEDILIRDFDAQCYNNGTLYRDVRNLYNRFVDDYYAFIEYNGIKDGEVLKQLRETINKLGKSVGQQNEKFKFDSGTYVMKNMAQYPPTSTTKVSYITTMGRKGNLPRATETMDSKGVLGIAQKAPILVSAMGGTDKATADERFELLRYYALTADRLYTRMDIDAFLRKELLTEFGKEEARRIFIKISIEGAAGGPTLQRGLYITLEFKDRKNFQHAADMAYDKLMLQRIQNKSCIAMPINVQLKNLEE